MERTEWPSKTFLQDLKEDQGLLPFSRIGSACFVFMSVLMALLLLRGYIADTLVSGFGAELSLELWKRKIVRTIAVISIVPAAGLLGAAITGLLQTGFFVRFDLGFKGERLAGFRRWSVLAATAGTLGSLIRLALCFTAGFLVFSLLAPVTLSWLVKHPSEIDSMPGVLLLRWSIVLVPLLFVLALVAWLSSRIIFRYTHRMTRAEVEAEYRQGA